VKISLFDGYFEFDWKALIGIGLIVLGYAIINM